MEEENVEVLAPEDNTKMDIAGTSFPQQYRPMPSMGEQTTLPPSNIIGRMAKSIQMQAPTETEKQLSFIGGSRQSFSRLHGTTPKKASFQNEGFRLGDAYDRLSDGQYIAKFDNFLQGTNNEERFAQQQTGGQKFNRGIVKFLGKTGTAILGSTVGSVVGLGAMITQGDWTAVYDNDFQNKLDDWNKRMDNSLAHYYTEEERDMNFLQSMGTGNFWANDFLGGLSFTVGAVAGEALWAAATGGASIGVRMARWGTTLGKSGAKAAQVAKGAKAIENFSQIARTAKKGSEPMRDLLTNFSKQQIRNATIAGNVGRGLNQARMIYTSAGYEAGVEARMYIDEQRETFNLTFEEIHGRKPTAQERAEFESNLRDTANTIFTANLALVGSSNLAIYGKMFNVTNPLTIPKDMFRRTVFGGGVKFGEKGVATAVKRNAFQRIAGTSYSVLKAPFIEGAWEEGMQSVIETAAGSYLESTYGDSEDVVGLMEAVYEGFAHTYGTKEGFKEVGLGMLIGLVGGGGSAMLSGQNPIAKTIDAARRTSATDTKIAETLNTYSADKLMNEIYRARTIQKATQEAGKAEESGDLVHGQAARTMGMMANIIYSDRVGYGEEMTQEISKALEGIDIKEVAKNLGITEAEATQMKEDSLAEYTALRETYKKNLDFSEHIIGAGKINSETIDHNIARESLAYQMTMADKFKEVSEDYTKAIMAEIGDNNSYGYQLQNYLTVQDILRKATKKDKETFFETQKQHKRLTRELERLEALRLRQEARKDTREDSIGRITELESTHNQIIEAQTKISELESKLEGAYGAMSLYAVEGVDETVISGKELAEIDKNLESVENYLQSVEHSNPEKSARLKALITGYRNSMASARIFSEVIEDLMNPKTGLKGETRTFLSKLEKYNNPTQRLVDNLQMQQKMFATGTEGMFGEFERGDTQQTQQDISEEEDKGADIGIDSKQTPEGEEATGTTVTPLTNEERAQIEEEYNVTIEENIGIGEYEVIGNPTREDIEEGSMTPDRRVKADVEGAKKAIKDKTTKILTKPTDNAPRTTKAKQSRGRPNFTQKIQELIKSKNYILQNFGDNVEAKKPTQEEITRYEELLSKLNIDPDTMISQSINTISKRGLNKIGLTREEVAEFKELNQKLSDWRLMDGVVEGDTSLSDVIEQKIAYETEVKKNEISELSESEEVNIANGVRNAANNNMSSEMVNTPETVMVRSVKGIRQISHLKLQDLVDKGAVVKKGGNIVENLEGLPKGNYTVEFGETRIELSLQGHQRLHLDQANFEKLVEEAGMAAFNLQNMGGSNWTTIYERQEDGSYRPMDTNFTITEAGSDFNILDPQALYDISSEEELFFKLSLEDSFNIRFREPYAEAKTRYDNDPSEVNRKTLEAIKKEIYEQISVYVVTSNNDVVGNLKGVAEDVIETDKFRTIRRHAAEIIFDRYDADSAVLERDDTVLSGEVDSIGQTMYTLPFTTRMDTVFIGSPNLTIEVGENGETSIRKNKFTNQTIGMVDSYGIVEKGEIQANESTPIDRTKINTQFIDKIDKATPFVVISYENQKIAYPISISTSQSSLQDTIAEMYQTEESNGKLAAELIKTLAENGMAPESYNIRHIGEDTFFGTEDEARLIKDLENRRDIVSAEEFLSKEYNRDRLLEQAEIAVDLQNKPFMNPKIKVDLKSTMLYTREAQQEEVARFNITGRAEQITKESIANQLISKKESELSAFHKKVLGLHKAEIEGMVKDKIKLPPIKAAESTNKKNEDC